MVNIVVLGFVKIDIVIDVYKNFGVDIMEFLRVKVWGLECFVDLEDIVDVVVWVVSDKVRWIMV